MLIKQNKIKFISFIYIQYNLKYILMINFQKLTLSKPEKKKIYIKITRPKPETTIGVAFLLKTIQIPHFLIIENLNFF